MSKAADITLVMGMGKSGMSVVRYLRARGEKFIVMDTRENPPGRDEVIKLLPRDWLRFGNVDKTIISSARKIIVSPGLSIDQPEIKLALAQGAEVIGDIELFAQAAKAPVIAITGSNGKSTVTSLLGEMVRRSGLAVKVGGNIGVPALDLLDNDEPDYYILELSSFQLETTHSLCAYAATLLNISADHMDRYNDISDYIEAKMSVYRGDGYKIINRDEGGVWLQLLLDKTPNDKLLSFGLGEPAVGEFGVRQVQDQQWLSFGKENIIAVDELKIFGAHNYANALAAMAMGKVMGLSFESMTQALADFTGLPHRTQWVACDNGVNWFNDSKGTNVGATIAAIHGLPGKKILIAGGEGKGADFEELGLAVSGNQVTEVILFGRDAKLIARALDGKTNVTHAKNLLHAVELARTFAKPGWLVLFSPACASFDMFENFEKRGEAFVAAVKAVIPCQ